VETATGIDLPAPKEALIEAVAATDKPLFAVLINGSALAVNWANEHANTILEVWYSGEEGGAAIAETLAGRTVLQVVYRLRSTRTSASCQF
jgi:beta-glucosidase